MSKAGFCFLLFFALFLISRPAACQDVPTRHFTIDDGLPSNKVYFAYRDSRGFIWVATDKGVARYNGIRFETFTTFDGLPDNEVFSFREDHEGRLWIATYNGELCYYKDGVFHTAKNTPFLDIPLSSPYITRIVVEKDSSVTMWVYDRKYIINVKGEKCTRYTFDKMPHERFLYHSMYLPKLPGEHFKSINIDSTFVIDSKGNITEATKHIYDEPGAKTWAPFVSQDRTYICNYVCVYDEEMNVIKKLKKEYADNYYIYNVYFNSGNALVATNKGLIIDDSIKMLDGNEVSSITQDAHNNYWATTLNNGVFTVNHDFFQVKINKDAYNSTVSFCQYRNGHLFFVDANSTINILENGKVRKLLNFNSKNESQDPYSKQYYYIDSQLTFFAWTKQSNLVVKNILDSRPEKSRYLNTSIWGSEAIKGIIPIGDKVYVNCTKRILCYDYTEIPQGAEVKYNVLYDKNDRIFTMCKSEDGYIWYSINKKIYKVVNDESIQQSQFDSTTFKSFGFFNKHLVGIDNHNNLRVYSDADHGVKCDLGAPQNCIWDKIYKLNSDHVLVSTNNLYRLITFYESGGQRKAFVSTIENPYIPLEAENICADTSNCYFFKNGYVTSIAIKDLLVKSTAPKLFFSLLKTGRGSYKIDSAVTLSFREAKNISISFSTLSFYGKDIQYQYSFSKNDQDSWHDVNGEQINLVNSGYGTFIIKVRAKTISSEYSKPISFTLQVSKPYWATWWMITLLICGAIAIVSLAVRYRIKMILHKREKEHDAKVRFMRAEYKSLNALMNPHFIFNTLNNVQSLFNGNDRLAANEYLRVFADLIRQNMHNVSKELIPLQKEMDLVANYLALEKLRFENHLNYFINIDPDVDISDVLIPPLLIQPLVENSLKHGILLLEDVDGIIEVNIYERNNIVYIEVKDNGVGMARSKAKAISSHESFGLDNIKKRIAQLSEIQNKEITFMTSEIAAEDGSVLWTIVTVSMPV